MQTFRDLGRHFDLIPAALNRQLSEIDIGRGRQEAFARQHPAALESLRGIRPCSRKTHRVHVRSPMSRRIRPRLIDLLSGAREEEGRLGPVPANAYRTTDAS